MLRLNYLKGLDIGRHRKIEKRIRGNVLGLWGVSGSGKSTVLQLLEWIITGKIEHPDPIAEFIRNNEHEDIKKMVGEGHFEVDGKPLEVERSQLRSGGSSRSVKWDKQGDDWLTVEKSAAGAEALMTSLVGANQKAISSIVFIRQGAFGKLFSGLDTERRDFFVRLLMLGHLEKIAGVIDTYRKQMMGSVADLSGIRDTAEAAYNTARANFESAEFDLSVLRSYNKELEAGAALLRIWDRTISREADATAQGTALDAILAQYDLDRSSMNAWVETTEGELQQLRQELKTAQDRRTSRNTYETNKARLESEITTITAWKEKSQRLAEVDAKIAEIAEAAARPDPRVRIKQLDDWEHSYRMIESLTAEFKAMPEVDQANLDALKVAEEAAFAADSQAHAEWQKAKIDLEDLQKLQSAAAGHSSGDGCRLCGNSHPDPEFITRAIFNTEALVTRLCNESNELGAKRRAAAAALQAAEKAASTLKEQRNNLQLKLAQEQAAVKDAPTGDAIVVERDQLHAKVPGYDAAKSMHQHLAEERRGIVTAMGGAAYTDNDLAARKSELDLATQMLAQLPPSADLQAEIDSKTTKGTELKAKYDKITIQRGAFNTAQTSYGEAHRELQTELERLSKEVPFLISSAQAIAPVLTPENIQVVLADFREKQTKFDSQTGQVTAASKAMADADKALQEIDVRIEEQKNRIIIGKELENVRAAFLPSGITTEYLSHQFERIAVVTQDHLAQMSADFMVISSQDRALSFDFMRLNEPGASWLNQNRMSGGQQVKLAIAVLLAIHELIIPQVGLLVLDEPSTHLDADSRTALAEVLKEIGDRGNFQLIVCDHSPELRDAYTDEIELTDASGSFIEETKKASRAKKA